VTLIDASVLIYAYNPTAPEHASAREWLDQLLDSSEVLIPWLSLWALLRISTHPRVRQYNQPPAEVFRAVRDLLNYPRVRVVEPGPKHAEILERLAVETPALGSHLTDAVLAALAIENGATLASTDKDFRRFDGLKLINPLAAAR
jgi:toxin-antitoxin system PIN domain toxin